MKKKNKDALFYFIILFGVLGVIAMRTAQEGKKW